MAIFIALLRAVNVGGTGKLPMSELKETCVSLGYAKVTTYIASGNVLFESKDDEATIKAALEKQLESYAGKHVGVVVRSAKEMAAVLASNPFPQADGSRTAAIFLEHCPDSEAVDNLKGQKNEELRLGIKELLVHYPDGIGQSKLSVPAAKAGTARNMNTVAKLVALAEELAT
jgi:uncharacterized protein (DUF1697 family)